MYSPNLIVHKASAGSGKTFTLAVSYIELLIKDPRAYREILAVTFTNKATSEMKERILSQLYGIATNDPDSTAYFEVLKERLSGYNITDDEIRINSSLALRNIVHDYSRFRVETIDSFFQSIMRNLARELDLNINLNVELNGPEVLSETVDHLLEQLHTNSTLLSLILNYINEKIDDNKRWDVSDDIKSFAKNILDEEYIEKGKLLRENLQDPSYIKRYKNQILKLRNTGLEELKNIAGKFFNILEAESIDPSDLIRGKSGISNYFTKLENFQSIGSTERDNIRNATVESCLTAPDKWVKKTSPIRDQIINLAQQQLQPLLISSEEIRPLISEIVNSCDLSLAHLNKLELLSFIDKGMRSLNKQKNRFLLSDTNALIHDLITKDDTSFLYEKIGATIKNIMIDEFQDTSSMQWSNFKPLLLEGLANGASSLIVGDVKQSIYRWRNGDWTILNNLGTKTKKFESAFDIDVRSMKINYRSETNIITFNNTVFPLFKEKLNAIYKGDMGDDCQQLLQAYDDVIQESPKKENKGFAKVSFIEGDKTEYIDSTLASLADDINALTNDHNIHPSDIAILVRKNKNIPLIADYLAEQTNIQIVSDEAFRLDASTALNILISALRYLSDPENKIIAAQLAIQYQEAINPHKLKLEEIVLSPEYNTFLPSEYLKQMDHLREIPLYELLEKLFVLFSLEKLPNQDAYLFSFFDKLIQYLENESSLLDDFIKYWDEHMASETIPTGKINGIRILSIHKSKGLEFHTVIIPFCDWALETEHNDHLLWCSAQSSKDSDLDSTSTNIRSKAVDSLNDLDIVPINYSSKMKNSFYKSAYLEERLQLWVDNLNLLYVAFTRAGSNLIIKGKMPTFRKNDNGYEINSVSNLIYSCLPEIAEAQKQTWNPPVYEFGIISSSTQSKSSKSTNVFLQSPTGVKVKMNSLSHKFEFRQSNRSADFIAGTDEEDSPLRFINRGLLLHQLFSLIEYPEDLNKAILQLKNEGLIGSSQEEDNIRSFALKAFSNPLTKNWYSAKWDLFTECAIIYLNQEGQLEKRQPDRVLVQKDKAIVIDYKFGKPHKDYHYQVKEYMTLLSKMGYKDIEGYIWYVKSDKIVTVQ